MSLITSITSLVSKATGPARISAALANFDAVITELRLGIDESEHAMSANLEEIGRLELENSAHADAIARASTAVENLRTLTGK